MTLLQYPAIEGQAQLSASGADGRMVRTIRPAAGSMQTPADMSTLQKGMYMIRFEAGDGNVTFLKVLKQ